MPFTCRPPQSAEEAGEGQVPTTPASRKGKHRRQVSAISVLRWLDSTGSNQSFSAGHARGSAGSDRARSGRPSEVAESCRSAYPRARQDEPTERVSPIDQPPPRFRASLRSRLKASVPLTHTTDRLGHCPPRLLSPREWLSRRRANDPRPALPPALREQAD